MAGNRGFQPQQQLAQAHAYLEDVATPQPTLNVATTQLKQTKEQLEAAIRAIVDSQAKLNEPQVTDLRTKVTSPVTTEQLAQQVVTVPGANIQLQLKNDAVPTTVGRHEIPVQITYEDESVDRAILVLVVEVDLVALNVANAKLEDFLAQPVDIAMKSPDSLVAYQAALRVAQDTLLHSQNIVATEVNEQAKIDEAKVATEQALARLQAAINQLIPSEASQHTPMSEGLTRTMRQLATKQDLAETVEGLPNNATVQITDAIPTTVGVHAITALVTYPDTTQDTVTIVYTITTDKQALQQANQQLVDKLMEPVDLADVSPMTLAAYEKALAVAETAQRQAAMTLADGNQHGDQAEIDAREQEVIAAQVALEAAIQQLKKAESFLHTPIANDIIRPLKQLANRDELIALVSDVPTTATVELENADTLPDTVGQHRVNFRIRYADGTEEHVYALYTIQTYKDELESAVDSLKELVEMDTNLTDKAPLTVERYRQAIEAATLQLVAAQTILDKEQADQAPINEVEQLVAQANEQLKAAIKGLVDSQAKVNHPHIEPLSRTAKQPASTQDILAQIKDLTETAKVTINEATLPTTVGKHAIKVHVQYEDLSTKELVVEYTITAVKDKLTEAKNNLKQRLTNVAMVINHHPRILSKFDAIQQNIQQHLAQAQQILSNPNASQAAIDSAEATMIMLEAQLQLLMIDAQSDTVESSSSLQIAQPLPSNECPTCVEAQPQSRTVGYTQLPATGEMDTNLLAYTVATLTGLAGVVLGRKKKEDEAE